MGPAGCQELGLCLKMQHGMTQQNHIGELDDPRARTADGGVQGSGQALLGLHDKAAVAHGRHRRELRRESGRGGQHLSIIYVELAPSSIGKPVAVGFLGPAVVYRHVHELHGKM